MASPRKPRVPRPASGGQSVPDEAAEPRGRELPPSPSGGPPAGEGRGRVSVGASSKVTVLRTAWNGADERFGGIEPPDADLHDGEPVDADPVDAGPARAEDPEHGQGAAQEKPARGGKAARSRGWGAARWRKGAPAAAADAGAGSGDVLAFPMPRAKRIRRRAILVAVSAIALVAGLLAVLVFSPVLAVRTITVEGTKMLAPAQVLAALKPIEGRPLPLVAPDDVARLVSPIVQVKSVHSRAVPPNTLLVTVVERVPVALVKQSDGFSVVDGDGVEIARTQDQSAFAVPVIDASAGAIPHPTFLAITSVLGALPADILAQLATAKADSVDSVQLKLANGKTVIWGNAQDRDLKAKVLTALMKSTDSPAKGAPPVTVYDVSTPRHPVTR